MTFYSQSILDEIRSRLSIVSYVGELVPLKKTGRNFKGICPFHSEKTPSFIVSDEKEIYHCFGCGEGGNIFSFVMKYEGISFPEAVEHLAKRVGVTLPKREVSKQEMSRLEKLAYKKKLLFRVNKIVAQFFRDRLNNEQFGVGARKYLKLRGINNDISTQHFLGYADDKTDALISYLKTKKVPLELPEELGLIRKSNKSEGYYGFFRNRLIFPIISHRGEVVGFGGRTILPDDKESVKYLNSSDSIVYHKSHTVYGLDVAQKAIREHDAIIIVEGYMDVLALNAAGIFNVVAPLGTALTASHIRLLMRYSKNMVLFFDGDSAGVKAAERSLDSFMESSLMPKTILLSGGKDPDDWIKENGKEAFDKLLIDATPLLAWHIKKRAGECGSDVINKARCIQELKPYFMKIKDALEFSFYRRLLSDELKIDESDLLKELEFVRRERVSLKGSVNNRSGAEKLLLSLMLEFPDVIYRVKTSISTESFSDESYKTLFELIISESEDESLNVGRLLDKVGDGELVSTIHSLSLASEVDEENLTEALEDCIRYLTKNKLAEKLKTITDEIRSAEQSKDDKRVLELIEEKKKLIATTCN